MKRKVRPLYLIGACLLALLILWMPSLVWKKVSRKVNHLLESLGENAQPLMGAKLMPLIGNYRVRQILVRDIGEGLGTVFKIGYRRPVIGDAGESLLFSPLRTLIELNVDQSYLTIDPNGLCTFRWDFFSSNQKVDKERFRLGRFKIAGREVIPGCLKMDFSAILPSTLSPFDNVFYRQEGTDLIFETSEGSLEEIISFERTESVE